MHDVQLFDSMAHPTRSGTWLDDDIDASASLLATQMRAAGVSRTLAVDMGRHADAATPTAEYSEWVRDAVPGAVPIAFLDFSSDVTAQIEDARDRGFAGVKVHPRLEDVSHGDPRISQALRAASDSGLITILCTFAPGHPSGDALQPHALASLLAEIPSARVVLAHGGGPLLLELMEWTRPLPNVMLDLSFTMIRYAGSSIDFDLRHLCETYDQRICVGSDFPQYTLDAFRLRFDHLTRGLERSAVDRIAWGNLEDWFPR